MHIIARRQRPHPGAQRRLTDHDSWRLTLFATNTATGQLADLDLRHRQQAHAEDRIHAVKDSSLRTLPRMSRVLWDFGGGPLVIRRR